jgi:hypothetical protein
LNKDEKPSQVKTASILVFVVGVLHVSFGIQGYYFLSPALPYPLCWVFILTMIANGALSVAAGFWLWQQKSWAVIAATGIGVIICSIDLFFGHYSVALLAAILYWLALSPFRRERIL